MVKFGQKLQLQFHNIQEKSFMDQMPLHRNLTSMKL